jgi:isopenicillin N synthase-like dioxygenase
MGYRCRYEGGFARDWHEAIDLYKDFAADAVEVQAKRPLHGPNPWPAQVQGYRDTLETYVEECTHLGSALLRGIALGLRLPEDFFGGERAGDPFWVMRIIHYPPLQSSEAASEQVCDVERRVEWQYRPSELAVIDVQRVLAVGRERGALFVESLRAWKHVC